MSYRPYMSMIVSKDGANKWHRITKSEYMLLIESDIDLTHIDFDLTDVPFSGNYWVRYNFTY